MRTRTKLLGFFAAILLVLAGTSLAATASAESGPDLLPLKVTNNTGRSDPLHLYVTARNPSTKQIGYVDAGGKFTAWPAGAVPPVAAPDVSIDGPANGASSTLQMPHGLIGGRIYYSLGAKLNLLLTPDGLVEPAAWSGDSNRDVLFDWAEFAYDERGFWLNTTQVDMFAIPSTVSVTGSSGTHSSGALVPNGRDNIINGMKAAGMGDNVQTRADGTVLRVLSPKTGPQGPANFDSYIDSAWHAYAEKTLTVVPFSDKPDTKYFGHTAGDVMTFTDSAQQQVTSFTKPSAADVWNCAGHLDAPGDLVRGPISRTLCAALNRGTLGTVDVQPSNDAAQFYRNNPTNQYAKLMHDNMVDGRAYAFPFDDVGPFAPLVNDGVPTSAAITLGPFVSGGGPAPEPEPGPGPGTSTGVRLISDFNGKCIDVPNANFSDGVQLQMHDCNDTSAQKFTFVDGTLRSQNKLCVDVDWGLTANGTGVQVANCSGNPAQQFVLSEAGDLVNPQANKCVDVKDWNPADGAALQIWECAGTTNQKWRKG